MSVLSLPCLSLPWRVLVAGLLLSFWMHSLSLASESGPPIDPPCFIEAWVDGTAPLDATSAGARFGAALAIDGTRFAVGAPGLDTVWFGRVLSAGDVSWIATVTGPPGSQFGHALATVDGRWWIGAPNAIGGGRVEEWLFDDGDVASQAAGVIPLPAGVPSGDAKYGFSLAVDDAMLVIGAPGWGSASAPSGAVVIVPLDGSSTSTLFPIDGHREGGFGEVVAIAGDRLAVGAPRAPGGSAESGAAHLFEFTGSWLPRAIAVDGGGSRDSAFGAALSFSSEGHLAIGAPYRETAAGVASGAVFIVDDTEWTTLPLPAASHGVAEVWEAPSLPGGAAFGATVVADGTRWWIASPSAPAVDPGTGASIPLAGQIVSLDREVGLGELTPAETPAIGAAFGRALAVSDGVLLIGAPDDPTGCGGAFGCDGGGVEWRRGRRGVDCDGDGLDDSCARALDATLDLDGDGTLDRCLFRRGDLDRSGAVDLADPIGWLHAFAGQAPLGGSCPAAWDANGDDQLDLSDPVSLLGALFLAGPFPPPPFPGCGAAPASALSCSAGCTP